MPNKALLSDKFSAALQIFRRARRYVSLGEIMKNKINTFFIVAFVLTLSACAAKQTIPGAERVELVNDLPD